MTERRMKIVLAVWAAYLALAALANAIAYVNEIDARALAHRSFDFAWELGLPWRARHGEWVGRDFAYPIGPLWQLLSLVAALGQPSSLGRTLGGMHVFFPILSYALAAAMALTTFPDWKRRTLAFVALSLLAGHDSTKSLRSVASLAIVLAYVPLFEVSESRWRRPALTGAVLALFSLLSFEIGFLGLASLVGAAVFEAISARNLREPLERFGKAWIAIAASTLALGLVGALVGAGFGSALASFLEVTRAYGVVMIEGGHGLRVAPIVLFGIATSVIAAWVVLSVRDRTSAMWLGATLPLAARAIVRSDAEHVYAALMPLAGAWVFVALRAWPRPRWLATAALLLVAGFSFAWFGSRRDAPVAWAPSGFARALRTRTKPSDEVDITRIASWVAKKRAEEPIRCIGFPDRATIVHSLADVEGPTETSLRWTPSMKERLAAEIEREQCPYFVREIVSFDFPAPWQPYAFGSDFLATSRLYEPAERIGPSIFAAKLRAVPAIFEESPLEVAGAGETRVVLVPGSTAYRLPDAIPADHLLMVEYTLEVPWTSRLVAGVPWAKVELADDAGPIGETMVLPDVDVDRRTTAIVPVHAELAEWRWVAGAEFRERRAATRFTVRLDARPFAPSAVGFTLHAIRAVAPPDPPRVSTGPEIARLDLLDAIRSGARYARATEARVIGDSVALPPNPPDRALAEVYVPIRPAKGSCLFAELGVEGPARKSDGVWFEIHVIDGADRPRLLKWHNFPGVSPRPAELPLERWAGREVLLRFGTLPENDTLGDDARIYRPRIGPCAARQNLMHAFHDGRLRGVRGTHEVLGDTLQLELTPRGEPPSEVRAPLRIEPGSCLAVDLRAEGSDPHVWVGIDAGILEGRIYERLAREEIEPGKQVALKNLSLEDWVNRPIELRVTARPLSPGPLPRAIIAAARVHRCGDGAPWGFGKDAGP